MRVLHKHENSTILPDEVGRTDSYVRSLVGRGRIIASRSRKDNS